MFPRALGLSRAPSEAGLRRARELMRRWPSVVILGHADVSRQVDKGVGRTKMVKPKPCRFRVEYPPAGLRAACDRLRAEERPRRGEPAGAV